MSGNHELQASVQWLTLQCVSLSLQVDCSHRPITFCCVNFITVTVFTARAILSAVLGVVILSVRLSVRHTRVLWLIQEPTGDIFYTTRKGNHSSFLMPKISAKFQRGHPQPGGTKERWGRLKRRFSTNIPGTADRLRLCQLSSPVSVINSWQSAAMLITSTVEICIQHLGRVEETVFTIGSHNSVRLSHACFLTNPKNLPAIFLYHMKGQSF